MLVEMVSDVGDVGDAGGVGDVGDVGDVGGVGDAGGVGQPGPRPTTTGRIMFYGVGGIITLKAFLCPRSNTNAIVLMINVKTCDSLNFLSLFSSPDQTLMLSSA